MVEAALLGVAKSVLQQLNSPVFNEVLLLWNVDNDLESIKETIETITNFLHDADQRESKEHLVKGWLSKLRSVLYDVDDLCDSISYNILHKKTLNDNMFNKEVLLFFSKSNQLGFNLETIYVVKDLRKRIECIHMDMLPFDFRFQEENYPTRILDREETHSFVQLEDVIGRDKEKEEIISLLLPKDIRESLSVISIIGFGGLGKTTLARLVFDDERVKSGFDVCLWASITYISDMKEVMMTILTSILKYRPFDMSLDLLQQTLRENIMGKRFLLILDDVCDEVASNWLSLKLLLSCGKSGSKVLVTTLNTKVAQCLDAMKPYYKLNVLSEESAWKLFVRMTFEEGELSHDSELVSLGKEIVRKCGNAPLALVTVGSMLKYKGKGKKSWLCFAEKELTGDFDRVDVIIMQALKFSYNELPPSLKHCFAYSSLFPKGGDFDKDELVLLWLACGYLEPHPTKSLEEVGDECFFRMVKRGFFQKVTAYEKHGGLSLGYKCKMHDLLHELAIQVAGTEFLCLLEEKSDDLDRSKSPLRHISVHCQPDFLFDSSAVYSHSKTLRSLLFCPTAIPLVTKSLNLASFRLLRALNLSHLQFDKVPNSIGGMIHLRYLNLAENSRLESLPNSICKLHHLQTLIFTNCWSLKELPSEIGELVSLRHLFSRGHLSSDPFPSGLAKVTSLVTLDQLIVHRTNGGLRHLGRLDNLCGVLEVVLPSKGWSDCFEDARRANLSRKVKLNGLHMVWVHPRFEVKGVKDHTKEILEEFEPPRNIKYLKIERYYVDELPSWFSSLSNLRKCTLDECSIEYIDANMKALEILELKCLPMLKGWWKESVNNDATLVLCLPNVSEVVIEYCPNLVESIPVFEGIEKLTLRKVNQKLVSMLLHTPKFQHYSKLKELTLDCVKGLKCLPNGYIRHLISLKSLTIRLCDELSWVSSRGLAYLTSLEVLDIRVCLHVSLEDDDDNNEELPWKALQRLRILYVPWQSHLQEGLQYLTCLEELEICYSEANQVEADNEGMEDRGLLWKGLKRLHTLNIEFPGTIQIDFPKWIQYLRFLKHLKFRLCKELTSMSWAILTDMRLHSLCFHAVKKVINVEDSVAYQQIQFNSLLQFQIIYLEESLTHDIPWRLFRSLLNLNLMFAPNLTIIPDGIKHLTSLQVLEMNITMEVEEIPKWMINITSLRRLHISNCSSQLAERCKPETGVDWPLISHVLHLKFTIFGV